MSRSLLKGRRQIKNFYNLHNVVFCSLENICFKNSLKIKMKYKNLGGMKFLLIDK